MKTYSNALLAIMAGILSLAPRVALAEDVSIKVEPGVAIPLTKPQTDHYDVGGAMAAKILFGVGPYFAIGPSGSFIGLSPEKKGGEWGTAWGAGGSLVLRRPHDYAHNAGSGFSAISPWIDGDAQYVRTGDLDRFGVSGAVGAAVPTGSDRAVWVGPFVRYNQVIQENKPGYDSRDARTLIAGVSFEIGNSQKKPEPKVVDNTPMPPPPVEQPKPTPPPPAPKPVVAKVEAPKKAPLDLSKNVQFAFDSAVIRSTENEIMAAVVKGLMETTNATVEIQGHASSEGQKQHNDVLSKKRADSVKDALVKAGVPAERLSTQGFGSSKPIADNSTEEGRVMNRRVEFILHMDAPSATASVQGVK